MAQVRTILHSPVAKEVSKVHSPDNTISSLPELLVDDITFIDNKVLVEDLEDLPTGHSPFHIE